MLALVWSCLAALAGTPLQGLEVTPNGVRTSFDVTVHVRRDGSLQVEDQPVNDGELTRQVDAVARARSDDARVVLEIDPDAEYARVIQVLDLLQDSFVVDRVALEVGLADKADDPLSPIGAADVEDLDEKVFQGELTRPRRWKYPQNPYQSTDFTAYTREWGEAKLGVASASYGVLPRMQLGTSPALDVLGAYNLSAKGNFLRVRKFDMALNAGYYAVPVTDVLKAVDSNGKYKFAGFKVDDQDIFVKEMTFLTTALQASQQVVGGWSIHAGLGYTRASARGNLDLGNLPTVVLPGLKPIGGQAVKAVPRVVGEALDARFATDYRFNRRDSLIFQFATTFYGSVRGAFSGDADAVTKGKDLGSFKLALAYQQAIPVARSYRTSLAYQFSWEKVDLRFGVGFAAISKAWLLQAFDLSYRFGGSTRRDEAAVRKQYKRDVEFHDRIDQED